MSILRPEGTRPKSRGTDTSHVEYDTMSPSASTSTPKFRKQKKNISASDKTLGLAGERLNSIRPEDEHDGRLLSLFNYRKKVLPVCPNIYPLFSVKCY